jgi:sugar phosphate permease
VRWIIFGLACATSFLNYVHRYSWGVVRPDVIKAYNLTDSQMGWLDGAFNLTYSLCQFPGGLAGDVYGPRLVISLAAVVWSCFVVGPVYLKNFASLLCYRLGFGIAQSSAYPNLGKITQTWFPASVRTSVQGSIASLAGRAGAAAAPIIIATLFIGTFGMSWQASLMTVAIVGGALAVAFWFMFRNEPSEHPRANQAECDLISAGEVPTGDKAKPRFQWSKANKLNLGIFMSASFCSTFADNLFVFWMPQYLMLEKGFDPISMGLYASLPLWGGALGGLFGGFLNDWLIRRIGNRRLARRLVASTGKTIAAGLIACSLLFDDGRHVMIVLAFCKFFSDWSQPTWWGTVTDLGGPAAGRVFGMVNMLGSAGATVAGPVMGYVKQDFGWSALFLFTGGMYLVTALFWSRVDCTKRLVDVDASDHPGDEETGISSSE